MLALLVFDALAVGVAHVRFLADASGSAATFQALLGQLRGSVDQERGRGVAAGQAVQLLTALAEDFAIAGALALGLFGRGEQGDVDRSAVGGWHAHALFVLQESFLAEASDDAVAGADWAGMGVGAGGWAGSSARTEDFVLAAFLNWWQHHERGWWDRVDLRALFGHDAAAVGSSAEVSLLAGAAWDADARADGVGLVAGAVAALALTEFFVVTAHLGWHWDGLGSWDAAGLRWHADSVFVLQESGLAEASDDALQSAHRAWVRVGAGRGAGGAAWHEKFVVLALRDFRWVGEEHAGFWGFALLGWHADAAGVPQVSLLAEASDDAVLGADWAGVGVGAGRGAGGAAGLEHFIGWA